VVIGMTPDLSGQALDRSSQPTYCPIGSILAQKNREYDTASRNFALI